MTGAYRSSTVITGAAGALGSAIVRHLSSTGRHVAALVSPRGGEVRHTPEGGSAPGILIVPMDLTSSEGWTAALSRIEQELGPPREAVLVAGGWQGGKPFHEEDDDTTWNAMFKTNLETAHRSLRALLPGMVARGSGSIVVVGSRAAEEPSTGAGACAYTASKAAVVALSQAVAAEVKGHGVRVNAVLPGTIDTPANRRAMPDADPSKWVAPDVLARVIAFLLSDDARDITGAALPVYGKT